MLTETKNKWLGATLVALGFIIPVLTLHLGFYEWKDEEYNYIQMQDWRNAPLSALTMYVGHLWATITGHDTYLSYRILAYLCNTTAVLVACGYIYRISRHVIFSCITFFLTQLFQSAFGLYSYEWDTLSYMLLTVAAVQSLSYLRKPTFHKISFLAVLSAMAIFARVPNCAVIVVLAVLIHVANNTFKQRLRQATMCLAVFAITSIALILIIWGNIGNCIMAWNSENIITGHSDIKSMLINTIISYGPLYIICVSTLLMIFVSIHFLNTINVSRKIRYVWYTTLSVALLFMMLVNLVNKAINNNNYYVTLYVGLLILSVIYAIFKRNNVRGTILFCLTLLGYSIVSVAGSDCGPAKLLSIPFVPLIAQKLWSTHSYSIRAFLSVLAVTSIIAYPFIRLKHPASKVWLHTMTGTFDNIPTLDGIVYEYDKANIIRNLYKWAKDNDDSRIIFLGDIRYKLDYALGHSQNGIDRYPVQAYHHDQSPQSIVENTLMSIDGFDFVCIGFLYRGITTDEAKMLNTCFSNRNFRVKEQTAKYIIFEKKKTEKSSPEIRENK